MGIYKEMMRTAKHIESRLPEFDVLRVIAAIFVLLYHFTFREPVLDSIPPTRFLTLDIFTRYGFLGVQLFFLISGFVILMSAEQRSAAAFIRSRAKRIYPTFWICCTLTFIIIKLWGAPLFSATWGQYLINMTLLTDFFREYSIDGAYWSIFVEIKFYLFIFLILLFKKIKNIQAIYFFWILATCVFCFLPGDHKQTTEFLLSHYIPYFAMGSIFYLWWQGRISPISYATFLLSYGLSIYNSFYEIDVLNRNLKENFYNKWVYNFTVLVFLIIFYLILMGRIKIPAYRFIVKWGLLTYPLYLVHQTIGIIIMKGLGNSIPAWASVLIASGTVTVIAYVFLKIDANISKTFFLKNKTIAV